MAVGDFKRDASIHRAGKGGCPPKGHPRQCQSKTRAGLGEQCGQWAIRGHDYCRRHVGGSKKREMKGFYSRAVTGRLKDMIESAANDEERHSLAGEVDAARALCQEAMRVCAMVMDPPVDKDGNVKEISPELRATAVQIAQNSLEHVSKVVERMTKVLILSEATFDANQVDGICTKIINILFEHLEDDPEKLKDIVDEINSMKAIKKPDVQINIT